MLLHYQEVLNVNDYKLQELKKEWGEGPYKAVIDALMEMKEYNCLGDRSTAYELWNYKAGRKATLTECAEYMGDRVQELTVVKRRKTRRYIHVADFLLFILAMIASEWQLHAYITVLLVQPYPYACV